MSAKKTPAAANTSVAELKRRRPSKVRSNDKIEDVCAICQESGKLYALECEHGFHEKCLKQIIKLECPICRRDIVKVRADIHASITRNVEKYQQEQEEEEMMRLMQQYPTSNSNPSSNSHTGNGGSFFPPFIAMMGASQMSFDDSDDMEMNMAGMEALHSLAHVMQSMVSSSFAPTRPPQPSRIVTLTLAELMNGGDSVSRLPSTLQREIKLAIKLIQSLKGAPQYMRGFTVNVPISQDQLDQGELFYSIVAKFVDAYMVGFMQSPETRAFENENTDDEDFYDGEEDSSSPKDESSSPEDTDEDTIVWYD